MMVAGLWGDGQPLGVCPPEEWLNPGCLGPWLVWFWVSSGIYRDVATVARPLAVSSAFPSSVESNTVMTIIISIWRIA